MPSIMARLALFAILIFPWGWQKKLIEAFSPSFDYANLQFQSYQFSKTVNIKNSYLVFESTLHLSEVNSNFV